MPYSTLSLAVNTTGTITSSHVNTLRDNDTWFDGLLSTPSAAGQVPISLGTVSATYGFIGSASVQGSAVTTAKLLDGGVGSIEIASGVLASSLFAGSVSALFTPTGLCAWFRTAAEIASGWSREVDPVGRFLVGAGTLFGSTLVQETNYGSTWAHTHTMSGTVEYDNYVTPDITFTTPQELDAAHPGHGHTYSGTTLAGTWVIPSRGYVVARRS